MMSTLRFLFLVFLLRLTQSQYRKILDVEVSGVTGQFFSADTESDCESECDSQSNCFAFVLISGSNCLWYDKRFGFGDATFIYNTDSIYYEKPIDQDDTLGDWIQERIDDMETENKNDFLVFYRQPILEFRTDNPSDGVVSMTVDSAEECAKYCTRQRGVIDDETGARCHSFNFNSDTLECQLLTQYLQENNDGSDDLIYSDNSNWGYYEKLLGSSCWVVSQGCLQDPTLFTPSSSVVEVAGEVYESFCMENAKYYHEEVCIGYADVPTHVYWGESGVYGSWNSLDFTTGCVIDLKDNDCEFTNVNGLNVERFNVGKFRDSIGEDQFAAWYKSSICFERAQTWFDACGLDSVSDQIQISYPDTGEFVFYPFEECTCDNYGIKIDPASGLEYCRRDFVNNTCSRTRSSGIIDVYDFPDALCLDTTDCDQYRSLTYDFTSNSNCYLLSPTCNSGKVDFTELDSIYYEIGCNGEEKYDSWLCSDFESEAYCFSMAEEFSKLCKNDEDTSEDQFVVWYKPTGNIDVNPAAEEPYETTLIAAVDHDAAFTVSPDDGVNDDDEEILLADLSGGRYQTFVGTGKGADTDNTPWLRSISVYYAPPDVDDSELRVQGLTLALYEGVGAVQSYTLAESTIYVDQRNMSSDGEYITFPISGDVTLTELDTYTWSLTTSDANEQGGRVGYVSGNYYTEGASSFGNSWDHLFVLWVEYYDASTFGLLNVNTNNRNLRPWFEIWFWILIAFYICLILFLIFLHWKRKKEEKEDRERERQLQKDVINQYRTEALKGDDGNKEEDGGNNKEVELENSEERDNGSNLKPNQKNEYESVPRESALIEMQSGNYKGNVEEIDDDGMDSSEDLNGDVDYQE